MQEPTGSDKDTKMENMELDEAIQLLNFYKQKSADSELSLLRLQVKFNSVINELNILKSRQAALAQEEPVVEKKTTKKS